MNLYKFAVSISRALLIRRRNRASRAGHRVGRFTENESRSARCHNYRVGLKGFQFQRLQIHRNQTATNLIIVQNEREHFPAFVFIDFSRRFPFTNLFIERVKKLLTRRCARKSRSMMQSSAETPKIEKAFLRPRKRNAHSIEQIDDLRRHLAHLLHGRLVRQKIAAVNRVVEMFPRRIAFAFRVYRAVNSALSADRMRAFYRNDRNQIDFVPGFGNFHRRRKSRQTAADNSYF